MLSGHLLPRYLQSRSKAPQAFVRDGSADATLAQKQFFLVLVFTKTLIYINVIHGVYENNAETGGTSGV